MRCPFSRSLLDFSCTGPDLRSLTSFFLPSESALHFDAATERVRCTCFAFRDNVSSARLADLVSGIEVCPKGMISERTDNGPLVVTPEIAYASRALNFDENRHLWTFLADFLFVSGKSGQFLRRRKRKEREEAPRMGAVAC